nr:DUF3088 family protein [Desulfovibrio sp. Fe33]
MEGLLHYYPEVRERLDIRTIPFERPRHAIIALLGEEHQGCPCLVVGDPSRADGLPMRTAGGHVFIDDHRAIIEYLARNYRVSRPAHD